MMKDGDSVLGVVLAGGLSRRMGGGDKGLADLGGASILERIVRRMAPQVAALVLNANGDPARFGALGLAVVPDDVADFPGPLAGVLAALDHAAAAGFAQVVAVPCDAPFLPADLVARLQAGACEGNGAVAVSGGRRHPAVALWPVALRVALRRALLEEDQRRVEIILRRHGFVEVEWAAAPFDPFANVNDPEGLAQAAAVVARWPEA
ncbi:molybdenum cofactor guanylyltransferase MobA [Labrys monachus]|uniref:Molybdenum cofactor guanylyltransferase n=1 Tax=Labrys monachus TaxID=217067 RepID=A0ABU0FJL9_9HYPH|nr:molybdenum cofactor guanylyltransferase MobA [Labrys monachus]MDQ0394245.1 molybdopterin-guanine dinucleotide biosynthesis protein A [Labrys monachus]